MTRVTVIAIAALITGAGWADAAPPWTPQPTFRAASPAVQRPPPVPAPKPTQPSVLERELERAQEQALRDVIWQLRSMARSKARELGR